MRSSPICIPRSRRSSTDIKPQNVILAPTVGSGLSTSASPANTGGMPGATPSAWVPGASPRPEQYGYAETDQRADIYALGVLLRYLLTGSTRGGEGGTGDRRLDRVIGRCTAFAPRIATPPLGRWGVRSVGAPARTESAFASWRVWRWRRSAAWSSALPQGGTPTSACPY